MLPLIRTTVLSAALSVAFACGQSQQASAADLVAVATHGTNWLGDVWLVGHVKNQGIFQSWSEENRRLELYVYYPTNGVFFNVFSEPLPHMPPGTSYYPYKLISNPGYNEDPIVFLYVTGNDINMDNNLTTAAFWH